MAIIRGLDTMIQLLSPYIVCSYYLEQEEALITLV